MSHYPPLAEARNRLKIDWYRTRLEISTLRELNTRSDIKGLSQALGHLLLYCATGAVVIWFWSKQIWLGFGISLWFHGAVATFFHGTSTHELSHGTVFKTRWLNTLFLYLFSVLGWWNHVDYSSSHKHHHIYTLYVDADRENVLPIGPLPGFFALMQILTVNLFTRRGRNFGSGGFVATVLQYALQSVGVHLPSSAPIAEWLRTIHEDDPQTARKSGRWARVLILFHAAVTVVGVVTGFWVLPIVITLAPFIAKIVSHSVAVAQHSGMHENDPDFRRVARSMKLGPILSFLYWRMNWHCEHHMYAAVPFHNLRRLQKLIAWDLPEPKGLIATWREMLEIARQQRKDPSYVSERPLPETAIPYSERE